MLKALLVQFLAQATALRDQLEDLSNVATIPEIEELARPLGRAEDDAGSLVDHLINTILALDAIEPVPGRDIQTCGCPLDYRCGCEMPDPPKIKSEDLFKCSTRAKGMPF